MSGLISEGNGKILRIPAHDMLISDAHDDNSEGQQRVCESVLSQEIKLNILKMG
jgi:hypothetical protein